MSARQEAVCPSTTLDRGGPIDIDRDQTPPSDAQQTQTIGYSSLAWAWQAWLAGSMRALIAILLAAAALMAAAGRPAARTPATALHDLWADIEPLLRSAPGVADVELLVRPRRPKCRLIQICDVHLASLDDLARDLRDQYGDSITEAEISAEHQAWLAVTGEVQANQRKLLRWLVQHQRVKRVFSEGLTQADVPVYRMIVTAIRRNPTSDAALRVGAAGQLLAAGELADVLPAEDEAAFENANPFAGGKVNFGGPANHARETAIVSRMIGSGPLAVIVLGGGHDLADEVRQLGGGTCEYLKVWVEGYLRD